MSYNYCVAILSAEAPSSNSSRLPCWHLLLWLAALIILTIGVAFVPVPNRLVQAWGALILTIVYVGIILGFVVSATQRSSWRTLLIGANVSLLCWIILRYLPPHTLHFVVRDALTDATLTSGAVFLGALVGRLLIRTPNMLGPICGVIALIDIWGVMFGGIVAQLLTKAPDVASRAMTQGPAGGVATTSRYIIGLPAVGLGDYLFLGVLFAALAFHGLNVHGARYWVWPLMTIALLAVMFHFPALPGLLFIGLGVAVPNLKYFRYTREEKFALLYALIFVIFLTFILYLMLMRMLEQG